MIYLAWYLAVGVVVLAVIFIAHRLSKKDESQSLSDLLDAVNPERKTLQYRILNNIVAPVVAAVLVVAVWPVAIVMKAKEIFSKKTDTATEEEKKFAVAQGDLLEQLAITEIEQRELVVDPMNAVPDLPFGHLHAAWAKFLEDVGPEGAIWSFSANWTTTWGRKELRAGYVVVRGDSIGPHFLTLWKTLDGI